MRRFVFLLTAVGLVLSGLFVAPAASAALPAQAQVQAAVPVMAPQIVAYRNHQGTPISQTHKSADEIFRTDIPSSYCNQYPGPGRSVYLPPSVITQISASLLWVPSGNTQCNYMWVTSAMGFRTWGTCINKNRWGFDYGEGWNDSTLIIGVKHDPNCPAWTANGPV